MKRVHVITKAPAQYSYELRPSSSEVNVCVRNLSPKPVTIPAKTIIGSFSTTNITPPMLAQKIKTI